jgi:hypothetical protein
MKKALLITIAALFAVNVWGQTVYIPNGTNGIGTSTTGNVGIGTTSPLTKLQVGENNSSKTSDELMRLSMDVNEPGIKTALHIDVNPSSSWDKGIAIELGLKSSIYNEYTSRIVHYGNSGSTRASKLQLQTHSVTDGVWNTGILIDNVGNVGIGTTSPNYKFCVQTVDNTIGLAHQINGSTKFYSYINSGNGEIFLNNNSGNGKVKLNSEGNSYFNGGYVGIGTTAPAALLHIGVDGEQVRIGNTTGGRSAVVGSKVHDIGSTSLNYSAYFAYDAYFDDVSNTWKGVRTTLGRKFKMEMGYHFNDIRFSYSASGATVSWNDLMTIKASGNVGIGTTSPIYKLSVKGTIGCGEVKVENVDVWADFVFEPDYNLMSLKDLETFIQANKHLPEIPTTAEVQENGISVGEMNAKLLQKIEELTLYTIQQQELIEELKTENNTQKEFNSELLKRIEQLEYNK